MSALLRSELRQRIRGKRWWMLLMVWTGVLLLVVALVRAGALSQVEYQRQFFPRGAIQVGPTMFGTLALFVLGLMALVVPALSSTSINGEREKGTLALLQSTLYRPREIALAKFSSSFLTALAFLGASIPLALWSATEGGVGIARIVVVYVVLAASAALFVAIGLAASSLIRRPSLSTLGAYVVVFALTAGMPILFGLSLLTAERETVTVRHRGGSFTETRPPIRWRWLLLAPDPFVVLADAAPRQPSRYLPDPLEIMRQGVRASRVQDRYISSEATVSEPGAEVPLQPVDDPFLNDPRRDPPEPPPLWPAGLAIDAGLVALCGYEVLRKLHVPARRLAAGERVA